VGCCFGKVEGMTEAQAVVVLDRVSANPPDMQAALGPLDELFVTGCNVHLEQMSERGFCLILTRNQEAMRVNIFAPRRGRVHARVDIDEGFSAIIAELEKAK